MEKRIWTRPEMNEFAFAANEYVASCGPSGSSYIFECNANSDGWFSNGGLVYVENGKKDGFQGLDDFWNMDDPRSGYTPCYEKHETKNLGEFLKGYLVSLGGGDSGEVVHVQDVIIWTGEDGNNTHCTKNLNMNTWERTPS